jgi:hypothetical protein
VVLRSHEITKSLLLPYESLDATLLVACVQNGILRVNAFGDGTVVVMYKDGSRRTWSISFSDNAPAYLSYLLQDWRLRLYLKQHGTRRVDFWLHDEPTKIEEASTYSEHIEIPGETSRKEKTDALCLKVCEVALKDLECVFLCSDGVSSFHRTVSPGVFVPVPVNEVLEQILAIRSTAGEFLVRRMRRFLQDFCPKTGWANDDDVAVAAILND